MCVAWLRERVIITIFCADNFARKQNILTFSTLSSCQCREFYLFILRRIFKASMIDKGDCQQATKKTKYCQRPTQSIQRSTSFISKEKFTHTHTNSKNAIFMPVGPLVKWKMCWLQCRFPSHGRILFMGRALHVEMVQFECGHYFRIFRPLHGILFCHLTTTKMEICRTQIWPYYFIVATSSLLSLTRDLCVSQYQEKMIRKEGWPASSFSRCDTSNILDHLVKIA